MEGSFNQFSIVTICHEKSKRKSDNMNLSEPSDQDTLPESVILTANMTNVTTLCDEYCQESSEIKLRNSVNFVEFAQKN